MDKNRTTEVSELTAASLPDWLPAAVRHYLDHTEDGTSLRELARREGLHASTILRQVRRFENRREDPLMDEALSAISRRVPRQSAATAQKDALPMSVHPRLTPLEDAPEVCDEQALLREGMRVLRRLAEPSAVMAIAPDLDKAVVIRELPDGKSLRTAVLERSVAHAFALKDWVTCRKPGRVSTYEITAAGRAALKRMVDEEGVASLELHVSSGTYVRSIAEALGGHCASLRRTGKHSPEQSRTCRRRWDSAPASSHAGRSCGKMSAFASGRAGPCGQRYAVPQRPASCCFSRATRTASPC